MFLTLLLVTLAVALLSAGLVAWMFDRPLERILVRLVSEELGSAWHRYVQFAILVMGVSGGVRIWDLEKYITPQGRGADVILLNADRWTLEVYRTVIGTFQGITWMLLFFFVFALVAYVVLRGLELRHRASAAR